MIDFSTTPGDGDAAQSRFKRYKHRATPTSINRPAMTLVRNPPIVKTSPETLEYT